MDHGRKIGVRVARNLWCVVLAEADGQLQRYVAWSG
jgi:hypothetical protein